LALYGNQLSGAVPDFSNLPDIRQISLSTNRLSGTIPDFSNIPKLIALGISDNQLNGPIPNFSNLPELRDLILIGNQLNGPIPDFTNTPDLEFLILINNKLNGEVPDFSNLPNLRWMVVHDNKLSGTIPDFSNLPGLVGIYLNGNQYSGAIPTFSNLPNLSYLFLQNNEFSGPLPDYSTLDSFIISDNRFTFEDILGSPNLSSNRFDYAPQKLFNSDTVIYQKKNQFLQIDLRIDDMLSNNVYSWHKDSMPWTPGGGNDPFSNKLDFIGLQAADAGRYYASVTNSAAPQLTLYSNTINLRVCDEQQDSLELIGLYNATDGANWTNKSNWLQPGMPIRSWHGVSADSLGCVRGLDLRSNNLSGELPSLNLNTLDTLILEDNQLTGTIPELQIPFVRALNLSRNQLTGGFPNAMSNWYDIRVLNVSQNSLNNTIPPDLGDLCELTALQLNNNQIPGELPVQLTMLFKLKAGQVNFSNNLIDSLQDKLIWFCPFGDSILQTNPTYDRFLGICNVQCTGMEWDKLDDYPWIADTLDALDCLGGNCLFRPAEAGFVDVRSVKVVYTKSRCYTVLGSMPEYTEQIRFYDCAGHLLDMAVCDQNQFCAGFSAIAPEEFVQLVYDKRWNCGITFSGPSGLQDPIPGNQTSPVSMLPCSPNPTDGLLRCDTGADIYPGSLQVTDLLGRLYLVDAQFSDGQLALQLGPLPPGMYVVSLLGEHGRYLAKVVVR
jgi:Leucine-rich repeat (LRR) protein